jgi:hypothetical protein
MKLNTMFGVCGLATALCLSAGSLLAQNDPGAGPGGGGPGGGFGGGGPGGGGFGGGFGGGGRGGGGFGGFGGGGPGGGAFDPTQFQQQRQQRLLAQYQQTLVITNDDEWAVIQPLIQKVMDAQQALGTGAGMFGRGGGGRGGGVAVTAVAGGAPGGMAVGAAGMGPQVSDEQQALQQAIDSNAPAAEIRKALAAYRASRKVLQDNLDTAQNNLRKVLTTKQEAQAVLLGLLT